MLQRVGRERRQPRVVLAEAAAVGGNVGCWRLKARVQGMLTGVKRRVFSLQKAGLVATEETKADGARLWVDCL